MMNLSMKFEQSMKKIGPKTFLEYMLDKYPEDDVNWSSAGDGVSNVRRPDMIAVPAVVADLPSWSGKNGKPTDETLEERANEAEYLPKTIPNRNALLIDMPEEVGEILKAMGYNVTHEEGEESTDVNVAAEVAAWELVKNSRNVNELRDYLDQYPDSIYKLAAKQRIKNLTRKDMIQ